MAQSGYTPILIYGSGTASNIPSAANLTSSANGAELALNYADGKLYYKNSAGTVTLLADKISVSVASANGFAGSVAQATATSTPAITISTSVTGVLVGNGTAVAAAVSGTDFKTINSTSILGSGNISVTSAPGGATTQVQYNNAGAFAGSANFTFNGTTVTMANDASVNGLTVGRGAGAVATNTAMGASALAANTTGNQDTAFGNGALSLNTTGIDNAAFGDRALNVNTSGSYNTGVGYKALFTNDTNSQSTAVGAFAGSASVADGQTFVGFSAGRFTTTGANNTALGASALYSNTTASYNTAVGYQSGYSQTTAGNNTSFGATSLFSTTTGTLNTAIGQSSLYSNTTGGSNTALGLQALYSNTTASNNTAVGYQAGYSNTTGVYNIAIGASALYSNTTTSNNTAIGFRAGYLTTGQGNTFVGRDAGYNTTGGSNTFIGYSDSSGYGAGQLVTTGSKNTILGGYNGNQGSLDIRTLSNYVVLSDGDGNPRMYFDTNGIANLRSSMLEQMTISATAATGTINFDAITQSVLYYTTNASGNFTMNVRGSSGVTLNNSMVTGQSLTIAFLCTNGSTAYYQTAMTIDGSSVTPKWQGGTAPSSGNASSIDSYVYTIIKTGAATFTVLASQTKFA